MKILLTIAFTIFLYGCIQRNIIELNIDDVINDSSVYKIRIMNYNGIDYQHYYFYKSGTDNFISYVLVKSPQSKPLVSKVGKEIYNDILSRVLTETKYTYTDKISNETLTSKYISVEIYFSNHCYSSTFVDTNSQYQKLIGILGKIPNKASAQQSDAPESITPTH
jgi:hypothetical protein